MPDKPRARARVVVVEDEPYVRESLGALLRSRGYDVSLFEGVAPAAAALAHTPTDVVLTDLMLPGVSSADAVRRLAEAAPGVPIVVLTGFGTVASAVECLRSGAADYILKPADPDALEAALERVLRQRALERELEYLRRADADAPLGVSRAWHEVVRKVKAAAGTDSTVLLTGESGTGKDLLSRLIHTQSPRARGPFVRVNCAAIPLEMWESEFFGHRRGAFTGATGDRDGRFRLAHRGTLFIDEIGAMPVEAQAKLLRVLQDGEFQRLGDEQPTRVDVRLVAATNSDIESDIASGRFRQDLYYRLNVVRIPVPPLRERPEDVPPLASRFVAEVAARLGRRPPAIAPETMADLIAYDWPGNVRELRNVIERALILAPEQDVLMVDLSPVQGRPATVPVAGVADDLNLRSALGRCERSVVLEAVRRSAGVRKQAARLLGIDQRNLGYYLRKHHIDPDNPA